MRYDQAPGASEPHKTEIGAFEVVGIDPELLLTTVHGGGTVKIRGTSEISYTFSSVPGSHPEKMILVSGKGDMSIIDAKNVRSMKIINPKTHDAIDIMPGLHVEKVFEYVREDGKIYSIFIKQILVTPGKPADDSQTTTIPNKLENDREEINQLDDQGLLSFVHDGGTVEIIGKSGSMYTFRSVPGGSPDKVIMVNKKDGEMEILDADPDLKQGIKKRQIFIHKKGLKRTEVAKIFLVAGYPAQDDKLYSQPLDSDLI